MVREQAQARGWAHLRGRLSVGGAVYLGNAGHARAAIQNLGSGALRKKYACGASTNWEAVHAYKRSSAMRRFQIWYFAT
eukprot:271301-Pleurochrysis_carterae.AAC.1